MEFVRVLIFKILIVVVAQDSLKHKAIHDFEYFISRLEKGYKEDYSIIMNTICTIDLYCNLKNSNFIAANLIHEYVSNSKG